MLILVFKKLKWNFLQIKKLELVYGNAKNINKIIKSSNVNKVKGPDGISAELIKISASITDCNIVNIIDKDISDNNYFGKAKTANVRPIPKG